MTNCEFKTSNYGLNSLAKPHPAVVRDYGDTPENMVILGRLPLKYEKALELNLQLLIFFLYIYLRAQVKMNIIFLLNYIPRGQYTIYAFTYLILTLDLSVKIGLPTKIMKCETSFQYANFHRSSLTL